MKVSQSAEKILIAATELAMKNNQVVGEKRDYYITLAQLEAFIIECAQVI